MKMKEMDFVNPFASSLPPLSFDLHPLYGSILQNGAVIKKGEVLGLDGDLRRVMVAPFTGVVRLLVTGDGPERRVKVFLSQHTPSPGLALRRG